MTTADNWNVDADGDWSNAANWSTGKLPTSNNTVTISTADVHTITHDSGSDVIDKLTVGQDFFQLNGGSLQILTTASFADGYTQNGGVLTTGAVSVTGPLALAGGSSEGSTAFTINGVTTLDNYTLGGSSVLNVASTADQTGAITLGDATGVNAEVSNASGATYDIAGDFGIAQGAASASFVNAGTLEKGSGSGTSSVNVSVTSTGTITAASGTLQLSGPTNTIGGTLSGAGQIAFGGGVTKLNKATVNVAGLGLYNNGTLNLGASLTLNSVLTDSAYSGTTTLNIGAYTLALRAASGDIYSNYGSAVVTGSGAVNNYNVLTLSNGNSGVVFGGSIKFNNYKTVDQAGSVTFGDGGGGAPTLTNEKIGVYDFTDDSSLGQNGATVAFSNLGRLEKTGTGGVSSISLAVTSTGTISAQSGALQFTNSLVDTGAISGSGTVQITGGGVATLSTGATLSVGALNINNNATLNVNTAISYAGVFTDSSNGNDDLNLGANLTLTGTSNTIAGYYGAADISGTGVLANQGTLSFSSGNAAVVVDGTTEVDNTGTINQASTVTIGGGGGQTASVVNAAGATWNVTGADTINNGAAAASHFDNAGTFNVNGGTGAANLFTTFNNQSGGVIDITGGVLQNNSILNNSGTISGTQFVASSNSYTYLNAGTSLTAQQFDISGNNANLVLGANVTFAGQFVDASDGATGIALGGHTLLLRGASSFSASYGNDNVTGSGILRVAHAGTISEGNSNIVFGGTTEFEVSALETVTGQVQIGDSGSNAATMVIDAIGKYDFTADVGISRGQAANSLITNNGLFEKTAGTGTSIVSVDFVNNGTITVTSGTLEFTAGTLSGAGKINGTETTDNNGDILITAASGGDAVPRAVARPSPAASHAGTTSALLVQAMAAFAPASSGLAAVAWREANTAGAPLAASHLVHA